MYVLRADTLRTLHNVRVSWTLGYRAWDIRVAAIIT